MKEVLFPYAEQRLESFMADIADTAEGQAILKTGKDRSRRSSPDDGRSHRPTPGLGQGRPESHPPLKAVQGMIWDEG